MFPEYLITPNNEAIKLADIISRYKAIYVRWNGERISVTDKEIQNDNYLIENKTN